MVSIVTWVMFPEELAPTDEAGRCLRCDIAGLNRLNSSPTDSQGWVLDAEKVLVNNLFQLGALCTSRILGDTASRTPGAGEALSTLDPRTRIFLDNPAKLGPS